jgi:WD40 repeat protein
MRKDTLLRFLLGLLFVIIILIMPVWAESPYEETVFVSDEDDGSMLIKGEGLPSSGDVILMYDRPVVWSAHLVDAFYKTTSISINAHVFAGTYFYPPMQAQLFPPNGGGIPDWVFNGTEFYTDASDEGFGTLGAIDVDGGGMTVIKWAGPGSGTPDWTAYFAGYDVPDDGPIAVSDDGSTIAAIASPGVDTHLLLFDSGSPTPLTDYEATGLGIPRYVKINADGRFTAFIAQSTIVVYDRNALSVRDQISMGFTNSALDISGDGDLIAYGWPDLRVMEWNGSSYQQLWSWFPGAVYLSKIAISTDGTTIVSCWYSSSFSTVKVAVHDWSSSTPLWIYDYPQSNGVYNELARDVDISDDGKFFVVGSQGDQQDLNHEVHIFWRDKTPHLLHTNNMPGSVFSVDISGDGRYVTAAGKYVHANVPGQGGYIVLSDLGNCDYIPGDCNHNGVALELNDVICMIGVYRGGTAPYYFCNCGVNPPGAAYAATADPNGNCVANELSDVVVEINAYRSGSAVSGCPLCP